MNSDQLQKNRSFPKMRSPVIAQSRRFRLVLVVFLCAWHSWMAWGSETPSPAPDTTVIAEGQEGFRVTQKDVQDLIDFFTTHTMFQTNEKEYRRYTVQTFLFAREAERLGLVATQETLPQEPIPKQLALAEIYLAHRLQNLQLEPEAIQSYYRAFPERFLKDSGAEKWRSSPQPILTEDDLLPLEQVASQIDAFFRGQMKRTVEGAAFQELMVHYQVVMK
ncbi:MAG: hypothetical protein ACUVWY_13845 [Desulfosoma sp.]|uniref:hypothetical protein n=1 Tax=Desulfosoma sp. TaxID=2603217 RepID=UPI00404B9381